MALLPATQVRSIDPFDSKRFSRTHNLKTRMWTMGNNYVLFPDDSFIGTTHGDYYLDYTPGVAIMSDVMIHITAAKTFNFRDNEFFNKTNDKVLSLRGRLCSAY